MGYLSAFANIPEIKIHKSEKLHGKPLNLAIGFIAGCGFLMFGYDQGVMSALLTLDDFQRQFPLATPYSPVNPICQEPGMCTGTPELQSNMVSIYQIGCFLGAILILLFGDGWGRRSSTFYGTWIMIAATVIQAASHDYGTLCFGRIFGGIGNGMVTSTIPTWQSECAKPKDRGFLIMCEGMLISFGIMVSYWVDYGFYFLEGSVRWRFPIAFQSFFSLIVVAGIFILPDSPRWLLKKGRAEEALGVISRLEGKPVDSPEVTEEYRILEEALKGEGEKFSYKELFTGGKTQHSRRASLGVLAQFMQQFCGCNLITYYATLLFEQSLGFGPDMSRLLASVNGTEYWMASVGAMFFIERAGRRRLMFIGTTGMMISMAVLAGMVSTGYTNELGEIILGTGPGAVATLTLFTFNTFFAIGFLGMTWLIPAEINPLRTRVQANALSTCSNWLSNYVIVMITPPAIANIGYRTYIIFAIFNAVFIPIIYFFYPETKGRSLEELDCLFANAHEENISPVRMAKKMPRLEGRYLEEELIRLFGTAPPTVQQKQLDSGETTEENSGRNSSEVHYGAEKTVIPPPQHHENERP